MDGSSCISQDPQIHLLKVTRHQKPEGMHFVALAQVEKERERVQLVALHGSGAMASLPDPGSPAVETGNHWRWWS